MLKLTVSLFVLATALLVNSWADVVDLDAQASQETSVDVRSSR